MLSMHKTNKSIEFKMGKSWFFAFLLICIPSTLGWNRSALIYHLDGRDGESWKRNFMRVDEVGRFVGQWLFDHVILTAVTIHGKDIMYGGLEGDDLLTLLDSLSSDARMVDKAVGELMVTFPKLGQKLQISIAMPYIDQKDRNISVEGQTYHLSIPLERQNLVTWYVRKVNELRQNGDFKNVQILGLYYHREDVIDVYEDVEIITHFNKEIHKMGMKSVWVPYYNAPHAWDGKTLGFDVLVVQPGYSFASSIDGGTATGDRLYAIGRKSATVNQCFEYELRSGGQDQLENWIAHQYLAIAQSTGAWKFPQVFFVGSDFFDKMTGKGQSQGDTWWAYSDLTNYLGGQSISNMEVGIPFSIREHQSSANTLTKIWTVPGGYGGLTSIRLDFNDVGSSSSGGYWKGRLVVKVLGGFFTSFSQRTGPDILDPFYSSVVVPLANLNITEGMKLVIELTKESSTLSKNIPWPSIIQLVGAKYEPPYLANPLYQEVSLAVAGVSVAEGPYADSAPTHKQYALGKLTDGALSPGGSWAWSGVMGWSLIPEGGFSITIDLEGIMRGLSKVKIWTHIDQNSAVRFPTKLVALGSRACAPQGRGRVELGCPADYSSGPVQTSKVNPNDGNDDRYLLSLYFDNATARWVTISGVPLAWFLMDEVEILDNNGNVLSRGKPYRVTPIPGEGVSKTHPYPDNARKLVDGAIFRKFVGGTRGVVGISREQKEGQVETTWELPKRVRCVRVWMTESDWNYGIGLPDQVTLQLRDASKNWKVGVKVATLVSCGPSPCARLCFAVKQQITGIRASFNNLQAWVMISEISVE